MQSSLEGRLDPEQHQLIECMNINVRVLNQPIDSVEQLIDVKPVILKLLFLPHYPLFLYIILLILIFSLSIFHTWSFFFHFCGMHRTNVRLLCYQYTNI